MPQPIFPFATSAALPANYGQGLYNNLMQLHGQQQGQQEDQIAAGSNGPANVGVQLQQLQGLNQAGDQQALDSGAGVLGQLATTDVGQRRIKEKRAFVGNQNKLNRQSKQEMSDAAIQSNEGIGQEDAHQDFNLGGLKQLTALVGLLGGV